jgi:hypothetical protein
MGDNNVDTIITVAWEVAVPSVLLTCVSNAGVRLCLFIVGFFACHPVVCLWWGATSSRVLHHRRHAYSHD